jgi:hypothetical protein
MKCEDCGHEYLAPSPQASLLSIRNCQYFLSSVSRTCRWLRGMESLTFSLSDCNQFGWKGGNWTVDANHWKKGANF